MIMDCWGGAKIRCEFSKTQINTDNIVLKTIFHNVPDSTLYVKPETIRKENTLIQGKNGEDLVLTKKGQVMGKTEFNATGGNSVLLKEYHRKSDSLAQWQINFSKYDAQTYAFDYLDSGNHGIFATDEYYPTSGKYAFRYKSVECGKSDKVIVDFGSYPEKDSVIFKDKYGVKLKVVDGNILSFTGVSKADTNFIYAYRGDKKIGKLFLNTYQQKIYKVVLISVNEAKLPNLTDLENDLNKVYNQCAVSFKIETRDLQVSGIENFTHGGTKVAGSVWNASQKTVLEAFGEKYEDNTAYLFFIPKAETGGVAGYMPRYYPYGFIYPGASNRTIAHELGHGIAGLEHPFPESQVSGSTQNLMDYRDGTELWHFQWDMLQDLSRKIFKWWQNEEDAQAFDLGANIVCITDEEIQKIKATQRYFYIADGRVVDLKDYNPSGFYTKDDKTESARGAVAKIRIDGYDYGMYYNKDTKQVSFFGYNTDPDHAAKKVEVAKLIVNDPEKIKLAQRVFPSDNTCDCKNFVTPENNVFKTLYAEMSEEDYTEAVDRLVTRLNQQVNDKKYLAVDGDADDSNEAKDYRDRFEVFHSATGNSIFVDVCCFNKKPTAEQIANMAQDVYEQSTLKNDDKSIYFVLPIWSEHKIKNDLRSYDKQYFSRSFYTQSQKYSGIAQTSEYKSATGNPVDIIGQFYRLVPKPHISIPYTIKYDGTIIRLDNTKEDNITGYSYIYDFKLAYEPLFDDYAPIIKRYRDNNPSYGDMYYYYQSQKEDKLREVYNRLGNGNDVEYVPVKHGLKESFLKPNTAGVSETAERYAQWFVLHKLGGAGIKDNLNNDLFVGGKNEVVYEETLSTIDELGFFLMTVGADFVTDAIGCLYAAYHQEKGDAAIYTAGFLGFAIPGGVLRKVLKNEYKIVREGENTIKVVDKSGNVVHQTKATIAGNLSDFVSKIKQLANDDATANVLITKVDNLKEAKDEFLTAFSILNDDELKLFLENPRMVDAWNDLNELLRQYPKAYESIIKNEMKIESLTKYADDPSNIARVKTTLDMSVAEIPVEWITDEICDKFFKNKSYLNVWNDLEKVGKERFSKDGFAAFDNYVKNRNITSEITDSEKLMTNILADVSRKKRQIGNELVAYDDLFKDYFKHLDPETLAKFDKQMLDAWHKMMDRRMPETWCRDVDIVEKIKSNNRYITYWDELKDVEAYPLTLKGDDFSVFDHYVTKQLGYTFKQMREIHVPANWLEDFSVIERFKQYSETCASNWKVLFEKNIIIEDFDFLYTVSKRMKDTKYAEISIKNIERTLSSDFRDEVVSIIKNQKLSYDDFCALVGDWEHCENFKIGKFKEMFKFFEKKPTVHLEFRKKAIKEFFVDAEGKDIRDAFIAEFISNPVSKVLSIYIQNGGNISNSLADVKQEMWKKDYFIEWIEACVRNALQSISSISPKNTFQQDLIKLVPHLLTNITYHELFSPLSEGSFDNFRTILFRELIKAFIDYGFNKIVSTNSPIQSTFYQFFKDLFHNLTDEQIEVFIIDFYNLLNKK